MRDLTKDPILKHVLAMAAPIAIGMLAEIAYQLVSLYFVTKLGVAATAGVNTAANALFVVDALTQVLVVGTVSRVAYAAGRRSATEANLAFNQSFVVSVVFAVIMVGLFGTLMRPYLELVAADSLTVDAGMIYIRWALPGFGLLLPMAVFSCSLRAVGIVQPAVAAYMLTVAVNILLAPFLVVGWGTGMQLGVMGAGLATSISVLVGALYLGMRFHRLQPHMALTPQLLRPRIEHWRRILRVGLPAGMDFALTFLSTAVVYYSIRNLGASAQAGFGIGWRVLQALLLPGIVVALSAAPIVGQNFGARNCDRVRETFHKTALVVIVLMIAATALVQWNPTALVSRFRADAESVIIATRFLQLMSWTMWIQGLAYACSTVFQGLGNTMPALLSSGLRFLIATIPALWLSAQPDFRIEQVWHLLIASVTSQAMLSLWLVRLEFRRRLLPGAEHVNGEGTVRM